MIKIISGLILAALLIVGIAFCRSMGGGGQETKIDPAVTTPQAEELRRTFAAIMLYRTANQGALPPDLKALAAKNFMRPAAIASVESKFDYRQPAPDAPLETVILSEKAQGAGTLEITLVGRVIVRDK